MEKPRNIILAVNLLWLSLAIGLVSAFFLSGEKLSGSPSPGLSYFILFMTFAVTAFFYYKISLGRGWARMIFAIFFVTGIPMFFLSLLTPARQEMSAAAIAVATVQMLLQGYVLFLLFTKPGSVWFNPLGKTAKIWITAVSMLIGLLFIAEVGGVIFLAYNMPVFEFSEGYYLAQKGKYEKAIEKYSSSINRDPKFGMSYLGRAEAYEKLGKLDLAKSDKEKAKQLGFKPELMPH